jgi:uncharacterized delta-60 repeat protein
MTAGDIDPRFGAVSLANTVRPNIGMTQPDGKVIVADQNSLARYNIDGSIDTSFGKNGQVLLSSLTLTPVNTVTAIALQPDGSTIIATGPDRSQLSQSSTFATTGLFKISNNGSIDQTFAQNARISSPALGVGSNLLSTQADGSIMSLGSNNLYRYNADGILQSTISLEGSTRDRFGNVLGNNNYAALQADNKILTADYVPSNAIFDFSGSNYALVMKRYNLDGTLDKSFGTNGVVNGEGLPDFRVTGLTTDADGKVVLTGANETAPNVPITQLVRYNSNGTLDTSFGTNGVVNTGLIDKRYSFFNSALATQADSKILVTGLRADFDPATGFSGSEAFLQRYNLDGTLDDSFGDAGQSRVDNSGNVLSIQADGDILSISTTAGLAQLSRYASSGEFPLDRFAVGTAQNDSFAGGRGNDFFRAGAGIDRAWGGAGNDTIDGEDGNDIIWGEAGDDALYGANGDDLLKGGQGVDYLHGGYGNDTMIGGEDGDLLIGDAGNDSLVGDDFDTSVVGSNDTLYGGDGLDTLLGNLGDDILDGENGNDSLIGGAGNDALYGANDQDTLDGGDGNDYLNGGYGNDRLVGAAGNDTLFGDDGLDTLIGGFGQDVFVAYAPVTAATAQADRIADFEVGIDKISLSKEVFSALSSLQGQGFSTTSDFAIVTGIEAVGQSNAVIVYNTANNSLTYKPLGTTAIFAQLDGVVTVSASDFQITD